MTLCVPNPVCRRLSVNLGSPPASPLVKASGHFAAAAKVGRAFMRDCGFVLEQRHGNGPDLAAGLKAISD
jgi:hypothetical protein